MQNRLRLRLTLWYLALSGLTYLILVVVALFMLRDSVTDELDHEMEGMIANSVLALNVVPGTNQISIKDWPAHLKAEGVHLHATIQVYDKDRRLLKEFGESGIPQLVNDRVELSDGKRSVRCSSDPIMADGKVIGYVQVQVPTDLRQKDSMRFAWTMAWLAPLLLAIMTVCGYVFSVKASQPVEQAFGALRHFLADAGHELGNPISTIQVTVENLKVDLNGNDDAKSSLSVIARAADRMARLVSDMMLLAKMEIKEPQLDVKTFSLDELLNDLVQEFSLRFREKGVALETGTIDGAELQGDPDWLSRMIVNLLENALRYTDKGGKVTVSLSKQADDARLSVSDTGIGIPEEALPHIFDRFYRVDKSRTRAAGGSGLGLSIVDAIVRLHHGSISVESKEGSGTKFDILLPTMMNNNDKI